MLKFYAFFSSLFVLMLGGSSLIAQSNGNFILKATSATATPQSNVCVDIKVHGGNSVLSMQYSMTYDPSVLAFESVKDFYLPGMTSASFGVPGNGSPVSDGTVNFSWLDHNNELQQLEDGQSLYKVCFDVIGAVGTYSEINFHDQPTPFEVIGINDASLAVSHVGGQVYVGGEVEALAITDCSMTASDCQNSSLGDINITVEGGTAPYSYQWLSASGTNYSTEDISDLAIESYALTVTDANNTTVTAFFQLNTTFHHLLSYFQIENATCQGNDGRIVLFPIDENAELTAEWSNGASGLDVSGLAAGTYTVTLTSATGCQQVETYTITAASNLHIATSYECEIPTEAMLHVIVWNESTGPFTFTLSDGQTVVDDRIGSFTVPLNSHHVITVTDANGCSETTTAVIDCDDNGGGGNPTPSDLLALYSGDQTVGQGETFCLPIKVDGFTHLTSLQFATSWDTDVIQFEEVRSMASFLSGNENQYFGLTDEPLEDGKLRFSWLEVDADSEGETLANGSTLFEVCFTAVGDIGDMTNFRAVAETPIPWEAIGVDLEEVDIAALKSIITIGDGSNNGGSDVTFIASTEDGFKGAETCVDISVRDFNPVLSMQFSLHWDEAILDFVSVNPTEELDDFSENNFGLHSAHDGYLTMAWHDLEAMNGVALSDDAVIFEVCFNVVGEEGAVSAIQFTGSPTSVEVIGANDQELTMNAEHGAVTVNSDGFVIPGDTDRDFSANHFDLLNIGLGFGQTGTARDNASLAFEPQLSADWNSQTPMSGIDYKHADTDGNGIVNADDILALIQNLGESISLLAAENNIVDNESREVMAPFFVETKAIVTGETTSFPIVLGTNDEPVSDLYGIAFSILYDKEVVEVESVLAQFENSWLGANEDLLVIQKDVYEAGRIDMALTRMDGQGMNGAGTLGTIEVTIKDMSLNAEDYPMHFSIENVKAISPVEMPITTEAMETIAVLTQDEVNGTSQPWLATHISIQPNPAQDYFLIKTTDVTLQQVEIYNIAGKLMAAFDSVEKINTNTYTSGTYLVKLITTEGVVTKRVMIQK